MMVTTFPHKDDKEEDIRYSIVRTSTLALEHHNSHCDDQVDNEKSVGMWDDAADCRVATIIITAAKVASTTSIGRETVFTMGK